MNQHLVFVFGTLKFGYGNWHRCLRDAKFINYAVSADDDYVMQDVGFPTLWRDAFHPMRGRVAGEIVSVNDEQLARCDRLESNGHMYTRAPQHFIVTGEYTAVLTAWVYLWNRERNRQPVAPVQGVLVWDRDGQRKGW